MRTRLFEVPLHLQPPVLKGCREALWTFKSATGAALVLKDCREDCSRRGAMMCPPEREEQAALPTSGVAKILDLQGS